MPSLTFTNLMTANQLGLNPLAGWQFERVPWPAVVKLIIAATLVGTRITVYSGSQTIQERSPISANGTIGVTPSELNNPAITFIAAAGDRLKLAIDEIAAGTPTVDGVIVVEPL